MTTGTREAIKALVAKWRGRAEQQKKVGDGPLSVVNIICAEELEMLMADNATLTAPAYDRELIATMLYNAITYVNFDRKYTDEAVRAQIDALRAADNADAAGVRTVARTAEGGVPASALRALIQAYVRLLETGRDRIRELGGECDPVDVMERSDIDLRRAREALTAAGAAQGGGEAVLLGQLEDLEEEWCNASAGKPSSRRIATFDTERKARGEDDFDNEVSARNRCASQLAALIARARTTPTPAAQPSDAVRDASESEARAFDDWMASTGLRVDVNVRGWNELTAAEKRPWQERAKAEWRDKGDEQPTQEPTND